MTDLVRIVRSGTVGLDLALGGGFRFVRRTRLADRESATLLIRGGPGTGKSVLAQDIALRLAEALGGDVLYACVEVLPSEVAAQRMGFEGFDPARVIDLSGDGERDPNATKPSLVLGLRDIEPDEDGVPDLGQMLLDLARIAIGRGFNPKIVVVDSLSDGYALGSTVPRPIVDGVCKLAVEQGWGLILVEEVADTPTSPWSFAVDTVLSLHLASGQGRAQTRRELVVTKHRFGPCEPGPHQIQIESERIRIIPPFSAYRNAARDLAFPPSSKNRSLRLPVLNSPPDWKAFSVPDGEGRLVILDGGPLYAFEEISQHIGRTTTDGQNSSGIRLVFLLEESKGISEGVSPTEMAIPTIHPFISGEEWLEHALFVTCGLHDEVSVVKLGWDAYLRDAPHRELHQAISIFVSILQERGLLIVSLCLPLLSERLRAHAMTDLWRIHEKKTGPDQQAQIRISIDYGPRSGISLWPDLLSLR